MSRPVTILLVEDDKDMRDGIAEWLETMPERYDMEVMKAGHGRMALELMEGQVPDLIVSDIMMPEMGGYEFLHHVRKNPTWVNIPFIFVSARGKEGDIRKGQLSDADLYITKPYKTAELSELIQTQLDRAFDRQKIRLETLESLKKNMLQILNHEFRTPLTYVTAYYDMLENNLDGRNYHEYLRGIQAGCVRLTLLVTDLIMIVELRSGEAAAKFQERAEVCTEVTSIVQAAIEAKASLAQEQHVQVVFTPAADVRFLADVVALQIVFERILDNGIKFSGLTNREKPEVVISTAVKNKELHICFQDTGLGIPEQMHQRIFDLFEQYNRDQMEQQGAGTGLTIANELVALHQGRIEVDSEVGMGSTFTVILPLYEEESISSSVDSVQSHGRYQATILLVEDEENLLYGLADLLMLYTGKYEFDVHTALNGKQALEIMVSVTPDLIVSDIMMPQMDGYELLKNVRKNPDWLDIPFIFLTAKGEKRDKYEGYRLGVEMYITKPYDSDDVLLLIEKFLDKHFQSQQRVMDDFEELKRNIVSLISPEFMQPLTAVSQHTTKLSEGLELIDTEEDLKSSLKEIQEGGVRLNQLIEDFISLAELETGEASVAFHWQAQPIANLGLPMYELCLVLNHQHSPDVKIHCPLNGEVPFVYGDSTMLMTCVERLITFTIKHAKSGLDSLQVSVGANSEDVIISIAGSRPLNSASEAVLLKILEDDGTINLADLPDFAAGLYLVKGYVGLHNGRVDFTTQPETGLEFYISLPIYELPPDN